MKMVQFNEQDAIKYTVYDGIDSKAIQGEGIREESIDSSKKKEDEMKKLLEEATNRHEMMADLFHKTQLQASNNVIFKNYK
jgi:hypothetical protein